MPRTSDFVYSLEFVYEIDEKGQRTLVRSLESTQRVYLRFTNRTTRPVDVWWRDFQGLRRHYLRLEPGTYRDLNSFTTHPWEFTDASTMERYVINNRPIYRAPKNIGGMMHRTNWNITITVRSLRLTALLALAARLRDPAAVNYLSLPRTVAQELQHLIRTIHHPQPTPR